MGGPFFQYLSFFDYFACIIQFDLEADDMTALPIFTTLRIAPLLGGKGHCQRDNDIRLHCYVHCFHLNTMHCCVLLITFPFCNI